jgi:hypothetical protein
MRKLLLMLPLVAAACAAPSADETSNAAALETSAHPICFGAFITGAWDGKPGDQSQSVDVAAELIASVDPSFTTPDPFNHAPFLHVPGVIQADDGPRRDLSSVPNDPQVYVAQWTKLEHDPATGFDVVEILGLDEPGSDGALNGAYAKKIYEAMTRADQKSSVDHQTFTRTSPNGAITCSRTLYPSGDSYDCRIGMVARLEPWSGCP